MSKARFVLSILSIAVDVAITIVCLTPLFKKSNAETDCE